MCDNGNNEHLKVCSTVEITEHSGEAELRITCDTNMNDFD